VTVRWEIADDEGFRRGLRTGQAQALPELAHSVHVEASGLAPDRWYFYRFTLGEWVSPVGRTRTLPAPDAPVQRLRLGYASCQRWEHGYFAAWRHLRDEQPDLVLFLGDYMYEYPGTPGAVRWPDGLWVVTTLDDYRQRHAMYKTDPDLQAMHAACPWFTTWDDHEVQNDYAGVHPGSGGPEVDPLARRAAAYQAYYEHMPLRASVLTRALAGLETGAEMRLYGERRFGQLARLMLLDTRQYKNLQACTSGGRFGASSLDPAACPTWGDPARSMLGAAQEQWLDAQLAASGGSWTVLGQSTLFGRRDQRPGEGQLLWNDGWDGYAMARQRLTQSIEGRGVKNAVLFGGDVHENWVGHVKADYGRAESASVGVEFCGTSISSRSRAPDKAAERLAENPHFVFADGHARGYGVADFTPHLLTVRLRGLEDATRQDSGVRTLASFAVQAGQARVEKA
jgi:alkaline phosphatase D